jgi:hypothetical protein
MNIQKEVLGITPPSIVLKEETSAQPKAGAGDDDDEVVFSDDDDDSVNGDKTSPEQFSTIQSPDTNSNHSSSNANTLAAVANNEMMDDFNEEDFLALDEIENRFTQNPPTQQQEERVRAATVPAPLLTKRKQQDDDDDEELLFSDSDNSQAGETVSKVATKYQRSQVLEDDDEDNVEGAANVSTSSHTSEPAANVDMDDSEVMNSQE